ncbi:MAG: hypothetical protein K0S09_632 [Sphingobacteriaceae bacterium]|jgi:hypothetical protein|nr:hypothetical protein [Sphingobacteriaceae bacterium]
MDEEKEKQDKPDLVVWDKEKGYYQKGLSYGSNVSAPAINIENISGWKHANAEVANKNFKTKFEEFKAEFDRLVNEVNINELVYSSKYNFIPVMGETYHLYRKADGSLFLSMVPPNTWKQEYLGSFKQDTDHKWTRVDASTGSA